MYYFITFIKNTFMLHCKIWAETKDILRFFFCKINTTVTHIPLTDDQDVFQFLILHTLPQQIAADDKYSQRFNSESAEIKRARARFAFFSLKPVKIYGSALSPPERIL